MQFPARPRSSIPLLILFSVFLLSLLTAADSPPATSSRDIQFKASTIGIAGGSGTAPGIRLGATLGQPSPVGRGATDGIDHTAGFWAVAGRLAVLVPVPDAVPLVTRLYPGAPNPFNPMTTLRFDVAASGHVSLRIYDLRGRLVRSLVDETVAPGRFDVAWNGRDDHGRTVSSGPYFCQMVAVGHVEVAKLLLVK